MNNFNFKVSSVLCVYTQLLLDAAGPIEPEYMFKKTEIEDT